MSIVTKWCQIKELALKLKYFDVHGTYLDSRNKLDSAYFTIISGQIFQLRCIPNQILMYPLGYLEDSQGGPWLGDAHGPPHGSLIWNLKDVATLDSFSVQKSE